MRETLGIHEMRWCLFLLFALFSSSAYGQANYDAGLIGGRSSLMGGTGVAVGTDGAAPLQNPATTVHVRGTSLALSTLFLQISRRSVVSPSGHDVGTKLSQTKLDVFPNSSCVFLGIGGDEKTRVGLHKISICIAEPEQVDVLLNAHTRNQDSTVQLDSRLVEQRFQKKVYAVGWAYALSEEWSLGVTPMLQHVDFTDLEVVGVFGANATSVQQAVGSSGGAGVTVVSKRAGNFAAAVLGGVQYKPVPDWSVGISVESPGLHLTGGYVATRSSHASASGREEHVEDAGEARFQYPLRTALGVAGRLPWLFFELDAYIHAGRSDFVMLDGERNTAVVEQGTVEDFSVEQERVRESVRPVVNVGLGLDIPLDSRWSVVAGVLSDFTGQRARQAGTPADERIFRSRMNGVHGSLGMAWTPRAGSLLFGVRGFFADGTLMLTESEQANSPSLLLDQNNWGLGLGVAGQFSLEMLAEVDPTGLFEKKLEKDPENDTSGVKK